MKQQSRAIAVTERQDNVTQLPQRMAVPPHFSFQEIEKIANAIARGGLFGTSNFEAVLTLCMVAHAEGQHPAVVFRDYDLIQGRPAKKAEAMHRDFLRAGGSVEFHRVEDDGCCATFSHPAGGSATIEWDWPRAKQAELGKRSSKNPNLPSMWEKYPRQMFRSRTISEGCRTVYPAATGGMYEPGEVMDIVDEGGEARVIEKPEVTDEQRRANAEEYTQQQLKRVADTTDVDALQNLITSQHDTMRRLARSQADLYQKIQKAYEARHHELNGYGGEAPDPIDQPVDYWTWRCGRARGMKDWQRVDADWLKERAAFPDDLVEQVDAVLNGRRQELKEQS